MVIYQSFKPVEGNLTTVGTDVKNYGGNANRGANSDTLLSVYETGIYIYTRQLLFKNWTLTAGLRSEFHSGYSPELIPMGGVNFNAAKNTTLKATVSKGFRNPTVMEMYLYSPNPALKPEKLYNYEVGIIQSAMNDKISFELNGFYIKADNLIQTSGVYPNSTRSNTGKISNYGIEFSSKYQIFKNLLLQTNYSYLHTGKKILAAPKHQLNITANYRYKIWGAHFSLQQINGLYSNLPYEIIQNYTLMRLRITVQPLKQLELFAMGDNLLNQQYEINDGYPMPGINFQGGLKVTL